MHMEAIKKIHRVGGIQRSISTRDEDENDDMFTIKDLGGTTMNPSDIIHQQVLMQQQRMSKRDDRLPNSSIFKSTSSSGKSNKSIRDNQFNDDEIAEDERSPQPILSGSLLKRGEGGRRSGKQSMSRKLQSTVDQYARPNEDDSPSNDGESSWMADDYAGHGQQR